MLKSLLYEHDFILDNTSYEWNCMGKRSFRFLFYHQFAHLICFSTNFHLHFVVKEDDILKETWMGYDNLNWEFRSKNSNYDVIHIFAYSFTGGNIIAVIKILPKFAHTAKAHCISLIIAVILKNIGMSVILREIRYLLLSDAKTKLKSSEK